MDGEVSLETTTGGTWVGRLYSPNNVHMRYDIWNNFQHLYLASIQGCMVANVKLNRISITLFDIWLKKENRYQNEDRRNLL